MSYYVCWQRQTGAIQPYLDSIGAEAASTIRILTYEQIFGSREVPAGHYIFTAHDRLAPEALEAAGMVAKAVVAAHPTARILNHPLRTLERYALLRTLFLRGLNPLDVARLDEGRSLRYPVFIRRESGTGGPETGLFNNEAEYQAALNALDVNRSRKGRIVVEFADTRGPDGLYRKYGVQRVGARLVPQHMFAAQSWIVKAEQAIWNDKTRAEEFDFIQAFPHRDQVMRIFEIAGIEYGRIDYGMIGEKVVTFEINTNPTLPRSRQETRGAKYDLVQKSLIEAFAELDVALPGVA